jgi:hypothetical protein
MCDSHNRLQYTQIRASWATKKVSKIINHKHDSNSGSCRPNQPAVASTAHAFLHAFSAFFTHTGAFNGKGMNIIETSHA